MSARDDRRFTRMFSKLTKRLLKRLEAAETLSEVKGELQMLEGLATSPNAPASAKTIYGCAYLMDEKPWYNFKKGLEWVRKGADEAGDNEPFCWFVLGSLYLNGKPELPQDMISAKYWIEKAAVVGYKDALIVKEIEWGDNPDGFNEWLKNNYDNVDKQRKMLMIAVPIVIVIVVAVIFLFIRR